MEEIPYCPYYCGNNACLKNRIHVGVVYEKKIKWDDFFECEGFQRITDLQEYSKSSKFERKEDNDWNSTKFITWIA